MFFICKNLFVKVDESTFNIHFHDIVTVLSIYYLVLTSLYYCDDILQRYIQLFEI